MPSVIMTRLGCAGDLYKTNLKISNQCLHNDIVTIQLYTWCIIVIHSNKLEALRGHPILTNWKRLRNPKNLVASMILFLRQAFFKFIIKFQQGQYKYSFLAHQEERFTITAKQTQCCCSYVMSSQPGQRKLFVC